MKRLGPDRVRKWSPACGLAALFLLTGCGVPFPAEDLDKAILHTSLKPLLGMRKEEVRERLGQPHLILVGQDKSYFLYKDYVKQIQVLMVGYIPMGWTKEHGGRALHCAMLEFGSDEVFERFETKSDAQWLNILHEEEVATDCRKLFWSSEELTELQEQDPMELARKTNEAQLRPKAERGDPEAQYELAQLIEAGSAEQWMWYCRAATQGHAEAQFTIADHFEHGEGQVSQDLIKAYVWYRAAETNGYAPKIYQGNTKTAQGWSCCASQSHSESLAEQMTPEQLAEAERLVVERQPDPSTCEAEAAAASTSE